MSFMTLVVNSSFARQNQLPFVFWFSSDSCVQDNPNSPCSTCSCSTGDTACSRIWCPLNIRKKNSLKQFKFVKKREETITYHVVWTFGAQNGITFATIVLLMSIRSICYPL